jgi:hypothetical protein
MADAPWVPLYHPIGTIVRHPRVRDYELHPLARARREHVARVVTRLRRAARPA